MKNAKYLFIFSLVLFLAAGSVFAAGSGEATTINDAGEEVPVEKGKLVYWYLFGGSDSTWMEKIVAAYNATNPAKQVQP
ncbi:MAG: ABC transporter substrate-binding protein, partial [Treponema sp.]|nr:ABC transporter substrate-binding protein [Treponema sp.]